MKLRFTPLALAEVETILGEIAMHSPQGARSVRNRLRKVIRSIRENPPIGQATAVADLRRRLLQFYPYVLFYRVGKGEIAVIGLRHAARDPFSMPG